MFHIEYVNCIGEILFTVDSTTLEEIGNWLVLKGEIADYFLCLVLFLFIQLGIA